MPHRRSIKHTRQCKIMDKAADLRTGFAKRNEAIDMVGLLEFGMRKKDRKFDWIVGGESYFTGLNDAEAYIDFTDGKTLVLREHIYENLTSGTGTNLHQARFVVAHELGHLTLHSRSTKTLPRRTIGSQKQYRENPTMEFEANIFAGSLLVPTTELPDHMTVEEISYSYMVSQSTAMKCCQESTEYLRIQKLMETTK